MGLKMRKDHPIIIIIIIIGLHITSHISNALITKKKWNNKKKRRITILHLAL